MISFPPRFLGGGLQFSISNLCFKILICAMALVIFPDKDFSQIFSDVHGYGTVFLDRIRERQWYGLVYDNTDLDTYYCPDLVKNSICVMMLQPLTMTTLLSIWITRTLRSPGVLLKESPKSHPPLNMLHHYP